MISFSKNKLSILVLGVSALSLNACGFSNPNAMPTGYTHHHEEYKSPIPPASAEVNVEQRKYMDAAQAEQFRNSVYDLLERLTMRAGMPPKPVFVVAPDPMTTFYANIDNDLRESMRHIGYAISDTPSGSYVFTYEATPIEQTSANSNNVHLTLRVFDSFSTTARQLTEESGQYFIQGAEELNIAASRYSVLPSPKQIQKQQLEGASSIPAPAIPVAPPPVQNIIKAPVVQQPIVAPAVKAPAVKSIAAPVASLPIPRAPAPVASVPIPQAAAPRTPAPTRSTAPAFVSQPVQETVDEIRPIVLKPSVQMPKISKPTISLKAKKPSHDDIIIINHGDKK